MQTMQPEVYIRKLSAVLPNAPVGNDQMEAVLGMVGGLPSRVRRTILRSNAITSRHYAVDPQTGRATHTNTELAAAAVSALFDESFAAADMQCLSCGTSYPDQILPGHGVMVHGLVANAPPCEVASLSGVCVAGMAAMKYAYQSIRSGEHRHAVAVASECASAVMRGDNFRAEIESRDWENARPEIAFEKDFLRWMLSDGAGAAHLCDSPNPRGISLKIRWIELVSYANEMPVCMYAGGEVRNGRFVGWKEVDAQERERCSMMAVKQDVKLLNENIVAYTVEKALARALAKHGLQAAEVDYFLPHYSSGFFRDKLAAGLANAGFAIPQEKWFTNLAEKGNTGSASIYIILEEFMRRFPLRHGQNILCYIPESGRFSSCFMLHEAVDAG